MFTRKVDTVHTIRATTSTAPARTIEYIQVPPLASFINVTVDEVSQILRKMSNKQCELNPMPTWLVKDLSDVLAHPIHDRRVVHTGLVSRLP